MSVAAILLCAGKGERLGAGVDKALVPLAGRPLFGWALEALQRTPAVGQIVVVGPVKRMREMLAAAGLAPAKVVAWSEGGRERQDSVARGLRALPQGATLVAIHDCARALVTPELIGCVVGDAVQHGAAIAALPLADTLKRGALGAVETTVPRQGLWCAQTPQVFRRDWIEAAHAAAAGRATDDSALVESLGHRVHLTPGDPLNFKITTPLDLELAEAWLTRSRNRLGDAFGVLYRTLSSHLAEGLQNASQLSQSGSPRKVLPELPPKSIRGRELGAWVLLAARRAGFNLKLLERELIKMYRAGPSVPLKERSAISYYLSGETLLALVKSSGDIQAAASEIAGEHELVDRVRVRVQRIADQVRKAASADDLRKKFRKLPVGYEEVLVAAWEAFHKRMLAR